MEKIRKSIIERLDNDEAVVGDGGYMMALELRGYVTAPTYTPEVVLDYPNAVYEIHHEFALCGADVLQAVTYNGTDDRLHHEYYGQQELNAKKINEKACSIVRQVADKYNCLVAGPISPTQAYSEKKGKQAVQTEVKSQLDVLKEQNIDFLITEFIGSIEEAEWIIEIMKTTNFPIAATLCISELGDFEGVSFDECCIRLAKTGADIIGLNCRFEPTTCVDAVIRMKNVVEKAGFKKHFMVQPAGFRTKDAGVKGFSFCEESPFALESRLISRFDAHKYARKAYDAGIRFIGGCCGFQPYHIRAVAEELHVERGRLPINSRGVWGENMKNHYEHEMRYKRKDHWFNLIPKDGR